MCLSQCRVKVVITATGVWRGPKTMGLKTIVDDALKLVEKGGHKATNDLLPCLRVLPDTFC